MNASVREPGYVAIALATIGLGLTCLVYGNFAPQWQTVPRAFPWPHGVSRGAGLFLVAGSLGLMVPRLASRAALALTAFPVIWIGVKAWTSIPVLTGIAPVLGFCESVSEDVAAAVGYFTLFTMLTAGSGHARSKRVARALLGASCVAFGLSHFAYAAFTAGMIPRWLPAHILLVYFTAGCHIAAGLALLTNTLARLAAAMEALMLGAFVLLVHLPSLVVWPPWAPSRQIQWTELCLALLISGAAGVVAASLRGRPWGWKRRGG